MTDGQALLPPGEQRLHETQAGEQTRLQRIVLWGGKLVALGSLSLGAGVASAVTFPSEIDLGPHRAEVALTFDSAATLDFGAPGAIIKPINLHGIGADIEIKEIPGGYTEEDTGAKFTAEDVEEYARFFSSYESDINEIERALVDRILKGSAAGMGLLAGLYALIGRARRQELAESAARAGRSRTAKALVAATVMVGTLSGGISEAGDRGVAVSDTFDGTMLEGARIEGKILQVLINEYGTDIIGYIERNDAFYEAVSANLRQAYTAGLPLRSDDEHDIMLYYTDLHCNIGMGRVIGEAAHLFDARIAVSGGDETMSGTDIEEQCIRVVAGGLGSISRVVSSGNHDSATTEEQFRKYDFTVLDGEAVEVEGYRFLGDDDPRRSVIGQEIRQERPETLEGFANRLRRDACDDKQGIDVLLTHDPAAPRSVLNSGCAKLGLSGHTHHGNFERHTDAAGNLRPQLTGGSAGGAEKDRPTLGPLQAEARFYILRMNRELGTLSSYQTVTIRTDGEAELGNPNWVSAPVSKPQTKFVSPGPR